MKNILVITFSILGLFISCIDSGGKRNLEKKTPYEDVIKTSKVGISEDENVHKIVVTETLPTGGYIYIKVKENEQEYWMAVPGREIKIGETYYYDGGMEMRNFESKTLKRTFDKVIFAEGVREKKISVQKAKQRVVQNEPTSNIQVGKASNGISIGELFENPKEYANKQVVIKGQVVKVNNGIMNVNFVHLQDGTKGNGQFDITITSDAEFKVGEIATIKGIVVLDKDFGAGYTYDVLVEKAEKLID